MCLCLCFGLCLAVAVEARGRGRGRDGRTVRNCVTKRQSRQSGTEGNSSTKKGWTGEPLRAILCAKTEDAPFFHKNNTN